MKLNKYLIAFLAIPILFSSCIKEEGAFREADIVKFELSPDVMLMPTIINQKGDNRIMVTVYDTTGMKEAFITPEIEVSPGAIVSPKSGETVQLKDYAATYIVTAEDGDKKEYNVTILPDRPQKYNFEKWYTVDKGNKGTLVYDMLSDPLWCNANEGVALVYYDYRSFPTLRTKDCKSGEYGMLLETVEGKRNSGALKLLDIPLYAGSAFRGVFKTNMLKPLDSAKFGQIHAKSAGRPVRFTGWYKYKSGNQYQTFDVSKAYDDRVEYLPGVKDELDIYAVLFKVPQGNAGKNIYLTASDVQTSDRIIASAIVEDRSEKSDWTRFDIPFVYKEGESMDYSQYDYKLAIVFSSSKRGAFYEGAIGSALYIDEVEVVTEPIE